MFNLGDIFATVKVKSEGVKEAIGGVKDVANGAQDGASKLDKFGDGFRSFAKATGAALTAVGVGLTLYAKNATDFTVEYVKSAKQISRETGATVEEASRLTYVMGRLGISTDEASQMFGIFSKKVTSATQDGAANRAAVSSIRAEMEKTKFEINQTTGEIQKNGDKTGELGIKLRGLQSDYQALEAKLNDAGTAFDKIGVQTVDATGKQKDFHSILLEVADKFKAMPDSQAKASIAMELFGKSGKDMLKVLNLGSAGIADLEKNADKLGLTLTQQNIGAVSKYIESQKRVKENADAIKIAVGTLTAPVLADFNNKIAGLTGKFQTLNPQMKGFVANVLAFGGPIATAGGGLLMFLATVNQAKPEIGALASKLPFIGELFSGLFAVISNPWVLLIIGIVVGLTLLLQHFGKLNEILQFGKDLFNEIARLFMDLLGPAIDEMKRQFAELQKQLEPYMPQLKFLAEVIGGALVLSIGVFIVALAAAALAVAYLAVGFLAFINFISQVWADFWGNISAEVYNAWEELKREFNDGVHAIMAAWNFLAQLPGKIGAWFNQSVANARNGINSIISSIGSFVGHFFDSGRALIDAFGNGIASAFNKVKDVVKGGLAAVRRLLPFSDAKEGPLADLTLSGQRLMETIAEGVVKGAPTLYATVSASLATGVAGAIPPAAAAATNNISKTINGTTHINGDININSKADADYLLQRLDRGSQLESMGAAPA